MGEPDTVKLTELRWRGIERGGDTGPGKGRRASVTEGEWRKR